MRSLEPLIHLLTKYFLLLCLQQVQILQMRMCYHHHRSHVNHRRRHYLRLCHLLATVEMQPMIPFHVTHIEHNTLNNAILMHLNLPSNHLLK